MIALAAAVLALVPAHPLGNFSINQLVELELQRDKVTAVAILDLAELPTLQNKTEAGPACTAFASDISVSVSGKQLTWQITSSALEYQQGAAGLKTSRLTCHLVAPAALDGAAELTVVNRHLPERAGWHELTATGLGVTGLPGHSVTDGLRSYPDDKLSSPLDVREAHLSTGDATTTEATTISNASAPGLLGRAEQWLQSNVSGIELTPWIGFLAVLLAIVLGAAHAALPGHGKTVMAVYLAGRAGRPRDALFVGATVTATHTGSVLLLGLLLTSTTWLAGETVLGWLGITSGAIIIAVGLTMLRSTITHARQHSHHGHTHHGPGNTQPGNADAHTHRPGHAHPDGHSTADTHHADTPNAHADHGHSHATAHHAHAHAHAESGHHGHSYATAHHAHAHAESGHHGHHHHHGHQKRGLAAIGIAGGLIPSPSALIVLLGAVALGRTGFGVLLVLAYGLGMAGALTLAGLTLLTLRDRFSWLARLLTRAPSATGALVLIVGAALAARSALAL